MNYRHCYHAGGFSDVFKHVVLVHLLEALLLKEKPLCYLDTHAGVGYYDLQSDFASQTKEFLMGIEKLQHYAEKTLNPIPLGIKRYLALVGQAGYPHYYPGSPVVAKALLRKTDRLLLIELHPEDVKALKNLTRDDARVSVHHQDGFLSLKALLPPKEKRGLILIDPAFEKKDEWAVLMNALKTGVKQFPTGVFALWYPIKNKKNREGFLEKMHLLGFPNVLDMRLTVYPDDANAGLIGSGMWIINPPFQSISPLKEALLFLFKALSVNGQGAWGFELFDSRS